MDEKEMIRILRAAAERVTAIPKMTDAQKTEASFIASDILYVVWSMEDIVNAAEELENG